MIKKYQYISHKEQKQWHYLKLNPQDWQNRS